MPTSKNPKSPQSPQSPQNPQRGGKAPIQSPDKAGSVQKTSGSPMPKGGQKAPGR